MKIIKRLIIIAICFQFGYLNAQTEPTESVNPTDTSTYFLQKSQLDLLKSATAITALKVHEFKAAPGETNLLEEFKIKESKVLTAEQMTQMQQTLASPANYFFTAKIKQCLFLPQVGLQVIAPNGTLNVLFSFDCETVRFSNEEGYALFNLHSGAIPFSPFFEKIFPIAFPAAEFVSDAIPSDGTDTLSEMSLILNQIKSNGKVFKPKMAAPAPIHYIITDDDCTMHLAQKVKSECDINIAFEKLCELNNLSPADLEKLQPGDAIIVGYEVP